MYISRRRLAVRDGAVGLRYNYRQCHGGPTSLRSHPPFNPIFRTSQEALRRTVLCHNIHWLTWTSFDIFLCSSTGGLLIDQVNICCTINVMGCTRLQCFATFRHEFSCQSVVTGGAGWLAYPSSPWYHGTAFIVNMVPWYSVHSQHGIMVLYGMVGTPIIVPPLFPQLSREMVLGSIVPTIVPSVVPTYQQYRLYPLCRYISPS